MDQTSASVRIENSRSTDAGNGLLGQMPRSAGCGVAPLHDRIAIYVRLSVDPDVVVVISTEGSARMSSRVNSLLKGLKVLEELNRQNGATLNVLAKVTGFPRGTTYRLLETLRDGKYVQKEAGSGTYALTNAVQGLADGYSEEAWIKAVAVPHMDELGKRVLWPLSVTTPSGLSMLVRGTTDNNSPLTMNRVPIGLRMPMEASATGRVYLAFCPREHCDTLLEQITKSPTPGRDLFIKDRRSLADILPMVRKAGYTVVDGMNGVSNLAVPVFSNGRVIACLSLRYFTRSLKASAAIEKYLDSLNQTAAAIGDDFESYQAHKKV
ncbi:MAG: helix-turn-helix domain-containing protein [Rhodospirillaceae bacterium]|nr:helix-turn-helix domain-containing protein [Rhodospirillaceae bacterium]